MKKLILMRHAEAQPEQFCPLDRDRPLALAGLQQLEKIRTPLQKAGTDITLVVCSNVKRARQTCDAVKGILSPKCQYEFTDMLYKATADQIVSYLEGVEDKYQQVMIMGHNPGLAGLLQQVLACNPTHKINDFKTADIIFFQAHVDHWKEVSYPKLKIEKLFQPERM